MKIILCLLTFLFSSLGISECRPNLDQDVSFESLFDKCEGLVKFRNNAGYSYNFM